MHFFFVIYKNELPVNEVSHSVISLIKSLCVQNVKKKMLTGPFIKISRQLLTRTNVLSYLALDVNAYFRQLREGVRFFFLVRNV